MTRSGPNVRPLRSARFPGGALRGRMALLAGLLALSVSCSVPSDAERAISRAIEVHGVDVLDGARVSFDFRGAEFVATRQGGWFRLERLRREDDATIRDVMTNEGTFREIDGRPVALADRERRGVETGVNSVLYFAFLPYGLQDPAVVARHLGEETLDGERYEKVEVTFLEEGGGRDWEDRFIYWFHTEEGTLDYLAYLYHTGDGGTRFRRAVNRRRVDGILVQDHENFVHPGIEDVADYGQAYEEGTLEWVSDIELENVSVESPPEGFPFDPGAPLAPGSAS